MKKFSEWKLKSPSILNDFPIDPIKDNYVRRVRNVIFSTVKPAVLNNLKLVAASDDAITKILDLDPSVAGDQHFIDFVGGQEIVEGSEPLAHRYGGYQFGYWADQLGDGRAMLLGEYINHEVERWELQLKGAGKTPYSRSGDGRAVLRSSIREFLCSEAMDALGIPTSRAAAIVVSSDLVVRDQFYNGRMKNEQTAVVLRLAQTWFRIGSLEILKRDGEISHLKQMVDFMIENIYPELGSQNYAGFFHTVLVQSISLVAKWMGVGFTHGVLNTDNLSLHSITIDYGPYGFLDSYEPTFIPNHSDDEGRYCYKNQPIIFKWNLVRLAEALEPLLSDEDREKVVEDIQNFDQIYQQHFLNVFRPKLGLSVACPDDSKLVQNLLDIMESKRADFTQTFRQLGMIDLQKPDFTNHWALEQISGHRNFNDFLHLYRKLLSDSGMTETDRQSLMMKTNPQYVLRNWIAESAIRKAETGDFEMTNFILKILRNPYEVDPKAEELGFSKAPPSWSCSLKVSCSS